MPRKERGWTRQQDHVSQIHPASSISGNSAECFRGIAISNSHIWQQLFITYSQPTKSAKFYKLQCNLLAENNENPPKNESKTSLDKLESIRALTAPTKIRQMVEQAAKQKEREWEMELQSLAYAYY